jgi:hypothetical protein
MKKIITFSILIIPLFCLSQTPTPTITPAIPAIPIPTNIVLTTERIIGNSDVTTAVKIDLNNDSKSDHTVIVNYQGYFEFEFPTALTPPIGAAAGTFPVINIWAEDIRGNRSAVSSVTANSSNEVLAKIASGTTTLPTRVIPSVAPADNFNPDLIDKQPPSTTLRYKCRMANTNFTVPICRFNLVKNDGTDSKVGNLILFNSIGAGIGVSWGELERTTNANSEVINTEFINSVGIHLGVLFSSGSGTEPKNIFAPTLSVSLLDIQFGVGYELGTVDADTKKHFFTVAYAIPLSKLLKGKFFIFKASKGYNQTHPLTTPPDKTNWSVVRSFQ